MQRIDSGALYLLNRILGLSGAQASAETELIDGHVNQTIGIEPIVRRTRTLAASEGYFHFILECINGAGATTVSATIDPYNPGSVLNRAPFPAKVPQGFDLYLLGASIRRVSGTASNFTEGQINIISPLENMAFGVDNLGVVPIAAASNMAIVLGRWDTLSTVITTGTGLTEQGDPWIPLSLRIRRGISIQYSATGVNAVTSNLVGILGMFPSTLGQDLVS